MIDRTTLIFSVFAVMVVGGISAAFVSSAVDEDRSEDIMVLGLELEKLVSFASGLLALALFIITFSAYRRENRGRMLYVSVAFALYSVRSFLHSSELFVQEIPMLDPVATTLDLVVLLIFFYGIIKK